MIKNITQIYIIFFLLIFSLSVSAQRSSSKKNEQKKAEIIYNIQKYLSWKNSNGVVKVGVLGGSKQLLKSLDKFEKRNRNFESTYILSPDVVSDQDIKLEMLYVGDEFKDQLPQIIKEAKVRNIAVISDGWGVKKSLMIDLIEENGQISYQVNVRNLKENNILVANNIKRSGAIIIDDKTLFEESEANLINEKERVRQQKEELEMQNIKLRYQTKRIDNQRTEIKTQKESIKKHEKEIKEQLRNIESQRRKLNTLAEKTYLQEQELLAKTEIVKEKELDIEKQTTKLNTQLIKAKKQEEVLEKQNKEIVERQDKISQQNLEINKQTGIIRLQKNALLIFAILFLMILALGFFLYRSYRTQKRQNILLGKQKQEIQEQTSQLENANKELAKLSVVASETSNAVAILDINGKFEWINAGFTRMHGYSLQLLHNELGETIYEASSRDDIKDIITKSIADKSSISYESPIITRAGEKKWTQTTISPTLNREGEADKLVMIDTDITEVKKAEALVAKQNKEIRSSIMYAKRIQFAVLTPKEVINAYLPEHFIMFRPRDIVSGDFYWAAPKDNKLIITAADCTGHGVPGAFMSMLGITFLNQIIAEHRNTELLSNKILDELRDKVKTSLRQTGKEGEAKDGMDMALCIIDKDNMTVDFTGAQNALVIIRNGEIIEYKGNIMPIGISYLEKPFENSLIKIQKDDKLYLFTDGYPDQFGGNPRKKFFSKRLKMYFAKMKDLSMAEQHEKLETTFDDWKGDFRQIDDVLVIGIKI